MHTHTHTHVYKCIDVQIHTHMHIYTYFMSAHIHTYTYIHTRIQNIHMNARKARLKRRRGSDCAGNLTPRSSALLPVRIATARRPDHIRLSALVRSRSTQFIVHASSQLDHGPPKRGHLSAILAGFYRCVRHWGLYTHDQIYL